MTICAECHTEFTPAKPHATFCGAKCRKDWNNRRATRGAVLYDAFMSLRYERGWAKTVGLWQLICRLASEWREEDQGAGRESYLRCDRWVNENQARLRAKVFHISIGRGAAATRSYS